MTDIKKYEPLWGSWYIDEQLGEGAYGKVFKVHKEEFGKTYEAAVKIISIPQNPSDILQAKSEGLNEESARSYFQAFVTDIIQEVDLMNAFHGNSNIVSLEDHKVIEKTDEIGWDIIIRMELLETLSSHITKKPMTQAEIIKLGIDICQALEICAKHNTIHRDIKPDNIFVSPYGDYKLGDFGIARQIERTMSGLSMKGTHQYMAPEVFKGSEYGSSVDTYSLGIVMYRFLNKNRAPFLPEYPQAITPRDREEAFQRRMSGEALPEISGINAELNSIVMRACAYNREERFKSASEMKEALENITKNEADLYLPVIISEQNNNNNNEFDDYDTTAGTTNTRNWNDNSEDRTQIIFSQSEIIPPESPALNEPEIQISEDIIKKLSISSSIFCGLLAVLTFFSSNIRDVITFLPLYTLCITQCYYRFENKIINYSFMSYLICYLLLSVLINFSLFDYSFLIFTLCLLSLTASKSKKFQVASCIFMIVCALILGILVLHINKNTHYTYVAGSAAIPFVILLSSSAAFLLEDTESRKINLGIALLIALQFFTLTIFMIYATGFTKNSQLLYHIINANFPGLSPERFLWWNYGRFIGIIIQIMSFTSLLMLAMISITPKLFLYALKTENKINIMKNILIIIGIIIFAVFIFV